MLAAALDTSNLMSSRDQIVFMQLVHSFHPPQLLQLLMSKSFCVTFQLLMLPHLPSVFNTLSDPATDIWFTHMPNLILLAREDTVVFLTQETRNGMVVGCSLCSILLLLKELSEI